MAALIEVAGNPDQAASVRSYMLRQSLVRGLRMTIAINALGSPTVALPVGIGDGLPQAMQIIGPRYREDLCLGAAAVEERVGIITPIDPR